MVREANMGTRIFSLRSSELYIYRFRAIELVYFPLELFVFLYNAHYEYIGFAPEHNLRKMAP